MIKIVGVRFRTAGKIYYFDPKKLPIKKGDHVIERQQEESNTAAS